MPDSKPPSRLQILEQGGRLVVIDRLTGAPPPTAAERMKALDAARAETEGTKPAATATVPAAQPQRAPQRDSNPVPSPWHKNAKSAAPVPSPALTPAAPQPPAALRRAEARAKPGRLIETRSWWDKKGPRTITLSEQAEKSLMTGLVAIATVSVLALILLWTSLSENLFFFVLVIIVLIRSLPTLGSALVDYGLKNSKKGQR